MDDRIGWLKLSPQKFAGILRGELCYKQLIGVEDLEVLEVKTIGQDVIPIVMIAIKSQRLETMDERRGIPPTICWNPEAV